MNRNAQYETGFTRQTADDDRSPEELARDAAARSLRRKGLIAGGVVLIAAVATVGVVQLRRDTPAKQFERAKVYVSKGEHNAAVIELKRSLQEMPAQPEARFLLAHEFAALGDAKNAEIEYRKALAGKVPAERVMVPLVESLMAQARFADVVREVNDSSIESPELNADLQTMLGTAYIALGKTEAGTGAFQAARDLVPNFAGAAIAEARFLVSSERYEEAEAMLASVPADDKRQARILALKGDIAVALKKPQEAFAAYEAAQKLEPANQTVRMQRVQLYIEFGQYDLAQSEIAAVTKAKPKIARGQYLAALVAYLRNDLTEANHAIDRSLQLDSANGKGQLLAGVVAMQLGELVSAEARLREAVAQLPPPAIEARKSLVNLYMQRRQVQQADEALQAAAAAQPSDPELGMLAVKVALLRGDAVRASTLFEQGTSGQPANVTASLVGASLLFTAGKPDAAIARLAAAAKAHPENDDIDVALVMGLVQARRYDAALAAWQLLDRRKPDSASTFALRSRIDQARGDDAAARQALERAATLDPRYFPATAGLVELDMRTKQPDQARARLERVIAAQPDAIEALLMLARVDEESGQPAAVAAELLRTARTRQPRSIQAIADTIAFHARHQDPAAQLAAAEDGLKVDPNNQDWLLIVGDLAQNAGRKDRALAAFTRLTTLNNEDPDYAVRLGIAQLASGQSEAALTSFRNAFKTGPQRVDLQVATVAAFLAVGNTDEATRVLFEVSKKSPDSPVLAELGADIKLAMKQFPDAVAAYRAALAATPSTHLAIKTYKALMMAKQRGEATAVLNEWERTHPTDTAMWLFDGQAAIEAKNFVRAADAYRKALDTKPDDPAILNNLAWTLDQKSDPQALFYAEKAYTLAPNDADAADTLGWILVNQGQAQRGADLIARATTLAPSKLDIRLRLAKAQIRNGRKDSARSTLQGVIDQAPDSVEGNESRKLIATL